MKVRDKKSGKFVKGIKTPKFVSQKKYYDKNKSILQKKAREKTARLKKIVYDYYGQKCACCGETRKTMLSIDHVNNDGHKDRSGRGSATTRIYSKIIREEFPNNYQILCMNCNFSKKKNKGVCEHIIEMYE